MNTQEENPKNALHKLLKEYESNRGMAGMVCGKPVSLMPQPEQDRLFNGFCTAANLQIFQVSREKFLVAQNLELDESEQTKVKDAIDTLEKLHNAIKGFMEGSLERESFRRQVQVAVAKPIPSNTEDLTSSLSSLIETLLFLSTQTLSGKDSWEQMIDCVQLHDALSRTVTICDALQEQVGVESPEAPPKTHGESVQATLEFCKKHLGFIESFFQGVTPSDHLQPQFGELFADLSRAWGDSEHPSTA